MALQNEGFLGSSVRPLPRGFGRVRIIRIGILLLFLTNVLYGLFYLSKNWHSDSWVYRLDSSTFNIWDKSGSEEVPRLFIPKTRTIYSTRNEQKKRFNVPNVAYKDLSITEKIFAKLNEISLKPSKYWLANTELTDYQLEINPQDFSKDVWENNPALFYDPRFTLSIYLNEIRAQYMEKNPENDPSLEHKIVVPFAWQDWVDLTMLNEELAKPKSKRKTCSYLKSTHHEATSAKNYCYDSRKIGKSLLEAMGLPSKDFLPGFAVRVSPTNKATNEVRMLEGKSHLLTFAHNPYSIIFLTSNGTYEAEVDNKKRIVDELFEKYVERNGIITNKHVLDPVKEFHDLKQSLKPKVLTGEMDSWGMSEIVKNTDANFSKNLNLPEEAFNYQSDQVQEELEKYKRRFEKLDLIAKSEVPFDLQEIEEARLTRKEVSFYNGLKYSQAFKGNKEKTYFRMARLIFPPVKIHDPGWHYEWRFFNGAVRYLKKDWTIPELEIREKVFLHRVLRNWFRFTNEKGIVSWIAHGVLLSWYWDGILFPFDKDIDVQMPVTELVRFSKLYNNTLIVEDIEEGLGKFYVDCSTFLHNREGTTKSNHIDARFIDVDTGAYIDITGLGISDEEVPERYSSEVEKAKNENKLKPVYNCRNKHFYSYDELIPLRYSMIDGIPCYVPNKIDNILADEYPKGMKSYVYDGYYFVDQLGLWIRVDKISFLFAEANPGLIVDGLISDEDKFLDLVKNIDEEQALRILERHDDIKLEYYMTRNITDLHKKEMAFMFNSNLGEKSKIGDFGSMRESQSIDKLSEYRKLTSTFTLQPPLRRSVFNYELVDKPLHHSDYITPSLR